MPHLFLTLFFSATALPQDIPSKPKADARVCVATVSNTSASGALLDRLTERLAKDLKDGGRAPSVDASDPSGGSSGPVHREEVQIGFALFRTDGFKPVVDTLITAQSSGTVSDNLLSAMDRESNRVSHELKKK